MKKVLVLVLSLSLLLGAAGCSLFGGSDPQALLNEANLRLESASNLDYAVSRWK